MNAMRRSALPCPAHRARGFTLVELLVTVAIAMFLLAGLVTVVDNTRRSEFVATIYWLDRAVDADFVGFFERKIVPALRKAGMNPIAYSQTGNDDLHMFVWLASFDDERAYAKSAAALEASPNWRDWISIDLRHRLKSEPQTLHLTRSARLWR